MAVRVTCVIIHVTCSVADDVGGDDRPYSGDRPHIVGTVRLREPHTVSSRAKGGIHVCENLPTQRMSPRDQEFRQFIEFYTKFSSPISEFSTVHVNTVA